MAEILPDLLAAFDARKRAVVKELADAMQNPVDVALKRWHGAREAENEQGRLAIEALNSNSTMDPLHGRDPTDFAQGREGPDWPGLGGLESMFVGGRGTMSKLTKERFGLAQDMEAAAQQRAAEAVAAGKKPARYDPQVTKIDTGWERNLDGNWSREISDAGTALDRRWHAMDQGDIVPLGDLFPHSELYKVYPHLQGITVRKSGLHGTGSWDEKNGVIKVGSGGVASRTPDMAMDRLTLLHEIQHAVQSHEGWAPGGNFDTPEVIRYAVDRVKEEAAKYRVDNPGQLMPIDQMKKLMEVHKEEGYRRLAGEAQARLTEIRADMGDTQRLRTRLKDQQDVPPVHIIQQSPGSDLLNLPSQSLLPGSVTDLLGLPPVKP